MKKTIAFLVLFISSQLFAQFPESFEGTTFPPNGWATFIGQNGLGNTFNWSSDDIFHNIGYKSALVFSDAGTGGVNEDWLVTPAFTITNTNYKLLFFQRQLFEIDYGTQFSIKVSTTSQTNISSFVNISTQDETVMPLEYLRREVDLSTYIGQTVFVAFVMSGENGDAWSIDDVDFPEIVSGYCLNAPYGQYPASIGVPSVCDGVSSNGITNCYAGEYSKIATQYNKNYIFKSGTNDLITITNEDGTQVYAYGTSPLTWSHLGDLNIRFYSHTNNQCGTEAVARNRSVICVPEENSLGATYLSNPYDITIGQGSNAAIYGKIFGQNVTNVSGQAPGVNVWIGISPINQNTHPNTWTTWIPATFDTETYGGNEDMYKGIIGSDLPVGTYYFAIRSNLNGGTFFYGGYPYSIITESLNGGFWDPILNPSGVLRVVTAANTNDSCPSSIPLTVGSVFLDNDVVGSVLNATTNGITPSCASIFLQNSDVWYSVVVPASGNVTVETRPSAQNSLTDTVMAVYSGSCNSLTEIACNDDFNSEAGNYMSSITLTGQTPGTTLYIGVWKWGTTLPTATTNQFAIAAYDSTLSNQEFDKKTVIVYPNPVKDILNIVYQEDITDVEVYNILGQKMQVLKIGTTNATIDMSNLSKGTYMVKVNAGNLVKTIKVVKE